MSVNECVLTGFKFKTNDPDEQISPQARKIVRDIVLNSIHTDEEFRKEVVTAILQDSRTAVELATVVLSTKAKDVGLVTSGSIADLFCRSIEKSSRKKTSGDNRTVESTHSE